MANPDDHVVLPEIISKEPLGPMVRHGDDQWFDLVKWVLFSMVDAEELGITQRNVDEMAKSDKPELKRVLGTDGNFGEQLGLTKDWVIRIVKAVGNYGETFDRNVGVGSPLEDRSRRQSALEQGRHSVRAADPLIAPSHRNDEYRATTTAAAACRKTAAGARWRRRLGWGHPSAPVCGRARLDCLRNRRQRTE